MKLIVGLGNPGPRYRLTRHNVGFMVLDEVARRHGADFGSAPADALVARLTVAREAVWIAKPLTFMNLSGGAVGQLVRYYRVELADLLVVADDVNLPLGRLRARAAGSAGGHNGLKSIIDALGTNEYPRLRLGVGRGDPAWDLSDRVLGRFDPEETGVVGEMVARATDAVELVLERGLTAMMNVYNQPQDESPPRPNDDG